MAHSDSLIFLTNITWIFCLFVFVYFFFALFFLPTFYKKFRFRVLFRGHCFLSSFLNFRSYIANLLLSVDEFHSLRFFFTCIVRVRNGFFNLIYPYINISVLRKHFAAKPIIFTKHPMSPFYIVSFFPLFNQWLTELYHRGRSAFRPSFSFEFARVFFHPLVWQKMLKHVNVSLKFAKHCGIK